ncbi:ABC transporter ATP-binding protein [Ulvibacterium marinum]|uniref:ABC transporter ATP-binding protein n=1 Tax=Ulvibacterium marinum TaxID=2419782 RepID=A0A3B0BY30_9FLAO|nr:ABC transporter ATP-binding protein [Ulvibacterium marinum]RKN77942.1 ABC transporter ATP-binding protein [Ulvibacterium marinum]
MINFENFSFNYNKKAPLYRDLNLNLEPGKIYGLLGRNGAGKSTLLNNITGLNSPIGGKVRVNGQNPSNKTPSFLRDIYIIPDDVYIPAIGPDSFLKIYGSFYPNFSLSRCHEYLELLEVPHKRKLNRLSFGQQKKFIIAFALACNTRLLIMDEPTNGLDIPSKGLFRKLIASVTSRNKTFIVSTHQVRDLDNMIDHVLIVKNGQLLLNRNISEISEKITFQVQPESPNESNAIHSESSVGGYSVMRENLDNTDTEVNIEQLFNACITYPDKIRQIFKSA